MSVSTREDVLATVMKQVDDNKGTLAVDWPGQLFDTNAVSEWIQPRVAFLVPARTRAGHEETVVEISINCFAKRSNNLYRHFEIADTVAGWFDRETLTLLTGGHGLRCQEAETRVVPQTVAGEEGLRQVNVTIEAQIIQ